MNDNRESVKTCSFLSKADIFNMKIPSNHNDFNVTVLHCCVLHVPFILRP